jgi:hypothetical protein
VFTGSGRTDLERAPNVVLPTQFTVEFKMKMDAWPGSKTEYYLKLQSATYTHIISVKRDGCFAGSFSASPAAVVTDTNYHVWTVTFDLQVAPGTLKMYKDGTLVGTWAGYSISSTPLTYLIMDTKDEAVATSRTDYIYMDSGIKPPGTTPPPPTQATITVRTWLGSFA